MLRVKIILSVIASISISCASWAQDVNYTQYNKTPLLVNPSMVGMNNIVSATIHHRSQELTPNVKLNASMLTLQAPLLNEERTRRWGGWGLSVMRNALVSDKSYVNQGVTAAYAYNLPLIKDHYLSFGMQAGFYQRKVALEGFTTGSQWNPTNGFDPDANLGESIASDTKGYFSGAVGFTYYVQNDEGQNMLLVGGSAHHINKPDISITENEDIAPLKLSGQAAVLLVNNEKVLLGPEFLYIHENNLNSYYAGARVGYKFNNDNPFDILNEGEITFKAGYRVNNAVTLETQIDQPNFSIGFSYDIAVGDGQNAGILGNTFEIALSLRRIIKPKQRYKRKVTEYSSIGEVRSFYFNKPTTVNQTEAEQVEKTEAEDNPLAEFGEGTVKFKLKKDFKFGLNDAVLNKEAKNYLNEMAAILKNNQALTLEVVGHTDNTGNKTTNKRVATQRALSVVDYLEEQGIDRKRMKVTALGASQPLVPNDSEENRAKNRRVEFIIYNE